MKRLTAIILTVLLTISFLSCAAPIEGSDPAPTGAGSSETEETNETFIVRDRQCTFANIALSPLIEVEDTFYYTFGTTSGNIYFSDMQQKDWMPLCFRPDCTHRKSDCNGHLEGRNGSTIWPYGEHIYYVVRETNTSPQLWRMKLDGSDHERILVFNQSKEDNTYDEYTWSFAFHNKYVFAIFSGSNEALRNSGGRGFDTLVYIVDMSADKPEMELTDLKWEVGSPVCGCGDTVYCLNSVNNNSITKVDLASGKAETLCELPRYPDAGLVLKGDRLYTVFYPMDRKFAYIDVNTGELTEICPLEHNVKYVLTDDYVVGSGSWSPNGKDAPVVNTDGTFIYDYEGNLVQHIPYERYEMNMLVYCSSGNYVFAYDGSDLTQSNTTQPPTWYLDLRELGSEDMTWHKWAPED